MEIGSSASAGSAPATSAGWHRSENEIDGGWHPAGNHSRSTNETVTHKFPIGLSAVFVQDRMADGCHTQLRKQDWEVLALFGKKPRFGSRFGA